MSWKTIVVTKQQKISVKNNQCCFTALENSEKIIKLDFTDINCILLENNYTLLSTQLLAKIAENNIFLISCNTSYDPIGIFLPFNTHWKPLEIFHSQITQSKEQKQYLWTKIIEQKIMNSLNVLHLTGASSRSIEMIERFLNSLTLNDVTNRREGLTAKVFFENCMGVHLCGSRTMLLIPH